MIFIGSHLISHGQSNEIKVKFIGNCGVYLTDGQMNLYVDFPYKSGAHKYMEYDASELKEIKEQPVFLFTHHHRDHYSRKLVRKVKREFDGKVYGNWNIKKLNELNNPQLSFSIEAIKTSHMFTLKHYSYVLQWHGKTIYFSGDTGDYDALSKLKNIDWAFMNPWLFMNTQNDSVPIDAKMLAIYHLYPSQKLPESYPAHIIFLKKQKETLSIPY